MELKTNVQIVKFNWAGSQPVTHSPVTKDRQRLDRFVSSKKEKLQNRQNKTLAQIHLRPLCYLGNSQSGVHVVRKTALNYSERENFQADLWSYTTRYGVAKESGYSHSLDTSQPFMAHLPIIRKGCLLQLTDVRFNWLGPTNQSS